MRDVDLCPLRRDYYSQLNNKDDSKNACFATTVVAGLNLVLSHNLTFFQLFAQEHCKELVQPEDILRWYLKNDKEVIDFFNRNHPNTTIPVVEWADCMIYGVNKFLKEQGVITKDLVYFDGNITLKKINSDLLRNKPLACSCRFPENNITGHYVLLVGCKTKEEDVEKLIINDPYKDWIHNTADGYHVHYTQDDWKYHFKGYGLRFNDVA